MKKDRILKLGTIFLIFLSLAQTSNASAIPDEQYVLEMPTENVSAIPHYGIAANGFGEYPSSINYLVGKKSDGIILDSSKVTEVGLCSSMTDSACNGAAVHQYKAQIGLCSALNNTDCISEVNIKNPDGTVAEITSRQSFPGSRLGDYTGDSSFGLPSGGSAPLLTIPSLPHEGGNQYLVLVSMDSYKLPNSLKFAPANIKAAIYAVRIVPSNISLPGIQTGLNWYDKLNLSLAAWTNPTNACPIFSSSECALPYSLPMNAKFGINLKLSQPVNGWLHGRMDNVVSDINVDTSGNQLISIQGNPIIVPSTYGWVKRSDATSTVSDFYSKVSKPIGGNGYGCTNDPNGGRSTNGCAAEYWVSVLRHLTPNQESMDEFISWLPTLKDKASKAPTLWRFETMGLGGSSDYCYRNTSNLSGFVATNATQYLSGPPTFNKSEATLDYKVAAPHYLPNGNEFLGTYNLIIDAKVARCLYGFTEAPIQASISITSASGEARIATTSLVERNGWFRLSANGFTFSNPTVRVKLSQEVVVVATPTPTPSATSKTPVVAAKKTSITCVKGKTSKKVTAVKPKCPVGYKKK